MRTTFDVSPKGNPGYSGGYDFDLLDPVEGTACIDPNAPTSPYAALLGVEYSADPLQARAEGAAAFDAITKLPPGADTILVTRVKSVLEGTKMCASIAGRGVRLIKSATPVPMAPTPTPPPSTPVTTPAK